MKQKSSQQTNGAFKLKDPLICVELLLITLVMTPDDEMQ